MKMKALVYHDQRNIQLTSVDINTPQEDEVLIKVTDAGLCQTQVNEFIEGPYIINRTPHLVTGIGIPIIVGHEFGGIVEQVGNEEQDSHIKGSQVAVLPLLKCGQCSYCLRGLENLCDNLAYYGLCGENGGFAEYACVKKENIFVVKDRSLLTFIEPLLVAIHAGIKAGHNIADRKICILGAGTIGICVAAVFRDYFGGNVVVNDILPNRLQKVQEAGLKIAAKADLYPEYDLVIDCAGNDSTSKLSALTEGFNYLKKGGELINIGTYFHPVSIVPSAMLLKEHKLITSYLYSSEDVTLLPEVINSLKINFAMFNTAVKLENIIEEGYYRAEVAKDSFTRLVVVP